MSPTAPGDAPASVTPASATPERRRAAVVGLGLIGGSVALALRSQGWHVTGSDVEAARAAEAVARGVVDVAGTDPDAAVTFVATPVQAIPTAAREALARGPGLVTDTGGVKAAVVDAVGDPRFVGGHPMAGSEHDGLDGADPELFRGATWVLTPTSATPDASLAQVRAVVASLGAEVVSLSPERHDALVAVVSHVPHLVAATLMALAAERSEEHAALPRLAAGGFRDMTRVASGNPRIWPAVCADNREAIVAALDELGERLTAVRSVVAAGDGDALYDLLAAAQAARAELPTRAVRPTELTEVRVRIPDRPGSLAEITTLAAELDVNIADVEIVHSADTVGGVLVMLVESSSVERFRGGLVARGYRPRVRALA